MLLLWSGGSEKLGASKSDPMGAGVGGGRGGGAERERGREPGTILVPVGHRNTGAWWMALDIGYETRRGRPLQDTP